MESSMPVKGNVVQRGSKAPMSPAADSTPEPPAKTVAGTISVEDDSKTRLKAFIIANVFRPG